MRKSILVIVTAIVFFITNGVQAQTAMFGTNPQHTGVYQSEFPSNLSLTKKWAFKTNGMVFSSAVVVNNEVFVGSDDSCLYALDVSGTLKWKFKSNGKIRSTPAVKDTVVYFNNYGGVFYAVNTKTGKEIWSYKTDGESPRIGNGLNWGTPVNMVMIDQWDFYTSSPVITDTIVYVGSGSNMYAFNLKTNELIWKYKASRVVHSSPAVNDGLIYFGCWDSQLYALNALTGKFIWSYQSGLDPGSHGMEGIQASPSVIDSIVLIGSRDANIYALHAKTGKKLWSQGFNGSWMPSSFAVKKDTAYTGSSDGKGFFSLNIRTGKINYSVNTAAFTFSTPAIANNVAFIGVMNGSLLAIDINTGKIKCKFDTNGRLLNPLKAILDDGTLNSKVFDLISGSDYELNKAYVRTLLTAGSILATPVIDKNTVYFGSTDSCVYAISDNGSCRSQFQVSKSAIALGKITSTSIDTVFYVKNNSDCLDSVKVYSYDYSAYTNIQPSKFTVAPHDSVLVRVKVNATKLKSGDDYQIDIVSQSLSNLYYFFNTRMSFSTPKVATALSQIEQDDVDVISPNPFSEFTTLNYTLKQNCMVNINIYNSVGQLVKVLVNQHQLSGEQQVKWDGTNTGGVKANSGLYYCSIMKGKSVQNKRIVLIK